MPIHNNQPPGQWAAPRPQYVPGSDPATANQGYTAQDFWDGKAGFGAGWGGAQKQEWLQNNMAPITGHNYIPDLTAHKANVAAELAANKSNVMGQMQANPAYAAMTAGGAGTGTDVKGDNRTYLERQGGMYGSGMNRQNFAAGLTTGDPTAMAAAAANTAKWKDPVFLDSYYKSILSPEDYAQWKAQGSTGTNPNEWYKSHPDVTPPGNGPGGGAFGQGSAFGLGAGEPAVGSGGGVGSYGGLDQPTGGPGNAYPTGTGTSQPSPVARPTPVAGDGSVGAPPGSGYGTGGPDPSMGLGVQGGMNPGVQAKPRTMPGGNPGYTGIAGRMWGGATPPGYWGNNSGGNPR